MNFTARLQREWSKLKQSKAALSPDTELDVDLYPRSENDLSLWTATILGPPDSPFEDHRFKLRLTVPNRYPLQAPKAHFLTKVCHPNVHFKSGEICLDVLKDQWTPSYTLESVCRTIIQLLSHPAADSPLNCDSGNMIRAGDLPAYAATARMYTLDYAQPTRKHFEKLKRKQELHNQRVEQQVAERVRRQQARAVDERKMREAEADLEESDLKLSEDDDFLSSASPSGLSTASSAMMHPIGAVTSASSGSEELLLGSPMSLASAAAEFDSLQQDPPSVAAVAAAGFDSPAFSADYASSPSSVLSQ